jgi:hypothetical protein
MAAATLQSSLDCRAHGNGGASPRAVVRHTAVPEGARRDRRVDWGVGPVCPANLGVPERRLLAHATAAPLRWCPAESQADRWARSTAVGLADAGAHSVVAHSMPGDESRANAVE